jgi:NADH-quinone oxidoreductase subunit M/multicomponent Na+:H+ antiporter subunit D
MLIIGFGLQAGMVPFHMWLPDAHMAAPSAISAVLSGVMVKAGVFGLIKVLLVIFASFSGSWRITLAVFAVLTMFVGNLSALLQDDIKRLLAYSTIANMGYILLGLAVGSPLALTGSLFQVLNHAVVKALLFLCTGAFTDRTKTRSLKELAGIRRRMPITGTAFVIGALSMASFPSLNIFWSELTILTAAWEAEMTWFSLLMIINLVFSAAYCLRLIQIVAIRKETSTSKKAKEASRIMLIPIIVLGFLSVLIGVYPGPFQALAEAAAQMVLNPT